MLYRILRGWLELRLRWTVWRLGRLARRQRRISFQSSTLADRMDAIRLRLATIRYTTRTDDDCWY